MSTQQATGTRQGYVAGEFLTRTYRISGEIALRGDPLLDQLNDHMAMFIQLERVFISPLLDPAVLTGNFKVAQVRIDSIGLVALSQFRDGLPRREGQYMGRDFIDRQVLIVTAGFEVLGAIRLHPSVDVSNFLRTTPERYVPVFEGSATLAARREIVFRGGALLVNRSQIEVFSMIER
jgi:hypothetical protein